MKKIIMFLNAFFITLVFNYKFFTVSAGCDDYQNHCKLDTVLGNMNNLDVRFKKRAILGGYAFDVEIKNVTTPNGSKVEVYSVQGDIPDKDKTEYDYLWGVEFPGIKLLGPSTAKYNCHSYAWYSSSTSNSYWMNDPSQYYKDGSYIEVETPRSGDVICYIDDGGTPDDLLDDINIHSGIVINYNPSISPNGVCGNANQVVVRSKWSAFGLYEHNGDYCPYVPKYASENDDSADYVKYYRIHYAHNYVDHYCVCGAYSSIHDYHDPYTWRSFTLHLATCGCGNQKEVPHAIFSDDYQNHKDRYATCLLCGGRAEIGFLPINASSSKYVTKNGSFILQNGVVVLVNADINDYLEGELEFIKINADLETQ